MLVGNPLAVVVPDTALLVPGASGRTPVLADVRETVRGAVQALLGSGPDHVVVVAHDGPRERVAPPPPDLTPTGVPWPGGAGDGTPARHAGVATSVALHVLADAGWRGATTVLGTGAQDGPGLRAVGADLGTEAGTVLLVAGSLSARHGPDGPLAPDDGAPVLDERVVADLAQADAAARGRLADLDPDEAVRLAVTAWGPLQVLVGAAGAWADDGPLVADLRAAEAPFGVPYPVAVWGRP